MKKKVCTRILALIIVLSLVGCGTPTENSIQQTTSDDSNVTQIESVVEQETNTIEDNTEPDENVEASTDREKSTESTLSEKDIKRVEEEARLKAE